MNPSPPRIAALLVRFSVKPEAWKHDVGGDLCEEFAEVSATRSRLAAHAWYWRQAVMLASRSIGERFRAAGRTLAILFFVGDRPMHSFLQEVRFAGRALLRRPGVTVAIVLTLALGLGANAASFEMADALVLRPMISPGADRLAMLSENSDEDPYPRESVSPANAYEWRQSSKALDRISFFEFWRITIAGSAEPERALGFRVTGDFFDMLGAKPALGRWIAPGDETPGQHRVVVLSDALWQQRYGGDPAIVGKTVRIEREPFTVIGVAPKDALRAAESAGAAGSGRARDARAHARWRNDGHRHRQHHGARAERGHPRSADRGDQRRQPARGARLGSPARHRGAACHRREPRPHRSSVCDGRPAGGIHFGAGCAGTVVGGAASDARRHAREHSAFCCRMDRDRHRRPVDRRDDSRGTHHVGADRPGAGVADNAAPAAQRPPYRVQLVVRASGDLAALSAPLRAALGRVDPDQSADIMPMAAMVRERTLGLRMIGAMMAVLGVLALVLATVGVYSLMSYDVVQRRHEIGVRMALGATPGSVLRLATSSAWKLSVTGVGIGLVLAILLARAMEAALFGVAAASPLLFLTIAVTLVGTALAASVIPSRQAARLDPAQTLRQQ